MSMFNTFNQNKYTKPSLEDKRLIETNILQCIFQHIVEWKWLIYGVSIAVCIGNVTYSSSARK